MDLRFLFVFWFLAKHNLAFIVKIVQLIIMFIQKHFLVSLKEVVWDHFLKNLMILSIRKKCSVFFTRENYLNAK